MTNNEDIAKITIALEVVGGVDIAKVGEAFVALDKEYRHFIKKKYGGGKPYNEDRLVLGKVKDGSYIFDLFAYAMAGGGFMFASAFITLTDFYERLSQVIEYLKNPFSRDKPYFDAIMMENMIAFMEIASKPTSHIEITISGDNHAPININSGEGYAIQTNAANELRDLRTPSAEPANSQFVLFTQLTRSLTAKSGNKGIISDISPSQRDVLFASPDVKKDVLQLKEANPLLIGFMADVEVISVEGRPDTYNILKINGEVIAPSI